MRSLRQLLLKTLLIAGGLNCFAIRSEATNTKLSPADPVAKNVSYVEDATRVDIKKYPTYAHGQLRKLQLGAITLWTHAACKLFLRQDGKR